MSVEQIKLLIETLHDIYTIADTAYQTISPSFDAASAGPALQQIDTLQQAVGSGEALRGQADQWAKFRLSLDSVLEEAVKVPLPEAPEFKLALDILTVCGESLCANRLAAVTALQEFSRLVLQRQMTADQQQQLSQYIANLKAGEAPDDAAMQAFYEAYVERKRWLFIALENYCSAYRYWALREPGFTPSVVQSVADLSSQLSDIAEDYENALRAFSPRAPQPFAVADVSITIAEADALAELRSSGSVSVVVGLDERAFMVLDRVRVDTVRVYLDGAGRGVPDGTTDPVYVFVSTSGRYADQQRVRVVRLHGGPHQPGVRISGGRGGDPDPRWQAGQRAGVRVLRAHAVHRVAHRAAGEVQPAHRPHRLEADPHGLRREWDRSWLTGARHGRPRPWHAGKAGSGSPFDLPSDGWERIQNFVGSRDRPARRRGERDGRAARRLLGLQARARHGGPARSRRSFRSPLPCTPTGRRRSPTSTAG